MANPVLLDVIQIGGGSAFRDQIAKCSADICFGLERDRRGFFRGAPQIATRFIPAMVAEEQNIYGVCSRIADNSLKPLLEIGPNSYVVFQDNIL